MSRPTTSILISGAGIAGPTLAYWLTRYGFTPTVIERAPHLRAGGYPVDVRFEAVQVAQRMSIWPRLQQARTTLQEMAFVGARGQRISRVNFQGVPTCARWSATWSGGPSPTSNASFLPC